MIKRRPKTLKLGQSRHGIMCSEEGLVMYDGMLLCTGEDEFYTYWLGSYMQYLIEVGDYDLEWHDCTGEDFMFQLGGPRSLEIVEVATEEDFHDLPFLSHRRSGIDGIGVRGMNDVDAPSTVSLQGAHVILVIRRSWVN